SHLGLAKPLCQLERYPSPPPGVMRNGEGKGREGKGREGKGREGKGREEKRREEKRREEKRREEKRREEKREEKKHPPIWFQQMVSEYILLVPSCIVTQS
ncbi:hypothetical protein HGM15179_013385, partial [Zosterops borbonicus]